MQQDFDHLRGPDGTVHPYQPIVGGVYDTPNPHPSGFVGGFTPHYSPVSNPYLPASSSQHPPTPLSRYNAFQPPSMDHFSPPPLPPMPVNLSYPLLANPYALRNTDPDNVLPFASGSHSQPVSSMTAVERSRNLRVAKTKPHLQFMVGPLLRYDTIENGIWRGAALIVSECAF